MNEIPAIRFVWEKYIGKVGFAVCQCVNDAYATPLHLNPDVTPIGYCMANKLQIRNRTEGFAVMVEMDGEEFWFHVGELPTYGPVFTVPLNPKFTCAGDMDAML